MTALTSTTITWSHARLSDDGLYRFSLVRDFTPRVPAAPLPSPRQVTFVMCNPSTAGVEVNDATVMKCIGFAWRWGYGRIEIVNPYAYRTRSPKVLLQAFRDGIDVVGDDYVEPGHTTGWAANRIAMKTAAARATLVVYAWGEALPKEMRGAVPPDLGQLTPQRPMCLGKTKSGQPRHPLMLAYDTQLEPF